MTGNTKARRTRRTHEVITGGMRTFFVVFIATFVPVVFP